MKFLDQVKIYVRSGDGGGGSVAFRRERFVEFGGPDGGNGGRGGNVAAIAVDNLNTLIDFRYQQHFRAAHGCDGRGADRSGRKGHDIVLMVPVGTQILDEERTMILADLTRSGQQILLAQGGDGGFGNAHYKTATNRAPRRASLGWPGEERWLWLRLKLVADAGLIGLPNAGKSTFLTATTRARPKIAPYPFTTLQPHLGVAYVDGDGFVIADIPGLIEGAHAGIGLGVHFLGHVERCGVLLHLIDVNIGDVAAAYRTVRNELDSYGQGLDEKTEILALNKIDALNADLVAEQRIALAKAAGLSVAAVRPVSGVSGHGLTPLLRDLQQAIVRYRERGATLQGKTADNKAREAQYMDSVSTMSPWRPSSRLPRGTGIP